MEGYIWWTFLALAFVLLIHYFDLAQRSSLKILVPETNNASLNKMEMPSPLRLPIIGHLHLLRGNPIIAMSRLSEIYGEIYKLHLGSVETIVITSLPLIKEVLLQKGADFADRPSFIRYTVLFGNDKENSLAFCDWSNTQKTRRSLARKFCHGTLFLERRVETALDTTETILIPRLLEKFELFGGSSIPGLKEDLQKACANIFFDFFCSDICYDWEDEDFVLMVKMFDEVFWEINQSHPTDVLPVLTPVFTGHLKKLSQKGKHVRKYVMERIINPHASRLDIYSPPEDFVDMLLLHLSEEEPEKRLTEEQVLYELEDFLGGHSAVSNLVIRAIVEIASCPNMSDKIYKKNFEEGNKDYIQAVIYETLRRTSSPIVPHIASCDTSINGYSVKKGTMVLVNNYTLNVSEELWTAPNVFNPDRFLDRNGNFKRPVHFFPFSYGKRACMGYQVVEKVTQGLILALIKTFVITPADQVTTVPLASVAIHPDAQLHVRMTPRRH